MSHLATKDTAYGKRHTNFKDLIGKKYGMLTVVRFIGINKAGTRWLLKCECGNEIIRFTSSFKRKRHKHSCGCVSKNPGKKNAGFIRMFNDYSLSAKHRGHTFKLNKTQFKVLITNICYYCGALPSPRYKKWVAHILLANGIDRIDNNKGYSEKNCVTCCSKCNRAKHNMSAKDFIDWARKVYYFNMGR